MGTVSAINVGIDVGSTTTKICALDARSHALLHTSYKRHGARQAESVRAALKSLAQLFPQASVRLALTGSGAAPIAAALNVPFVQEVVANACAIQALYPQTRCAIELGGQDAKMIFFRVNETTGNLDVADMRMNGSCAGGTGAFIDEIASVLNLPIEQFNAAAARGRTLQYGIRLHVIVRETEEEAWAAADRLIAHLDDDTIAQAQKIFARMDSAGQARMSALHQGSRDNLRIAPNLWAGVGLVRGGAGTALVGNPQQVAERIREYQALGISNFIFSGYPHLEEAHRFAELVMPLLPLENGASSKARSVNTGPFGETIGGDKRPVRQVSAS